MNDYVGQQVIQERIINAYYLNWKISRSITHMISSTQRGMFLPHIHLQVRKEVNIVAGREC